MPSTRQSLGDLLSGELKTLENTIKQRRIGEANEFMEDWDEENLILRTIPGEEFKRCMNRLGPFCAGPIAVPEWVEIQKLLAVTEQTIHKMSRIILCPRGSGELILSSCTWTTRIARVGVEQVLAVIITDIFTPPAYRGHGFARSLLHRLQGELDDAGVEVSVTFGIPGFLSKMGWKPSEATQLSIVLGPDTRPPTADVIRLVDASRILGNMVPLEAMMTENSLLDKEVLEKRLSMALIPSAELAQWHLMRSRLLGAAMGKSPPDFDGALWEGERMTSVGVWWTHDWLESKLRVGGVLELETSGLEDKLTGLLAEAVGEAIAHVFGEVVVWDPSQQVADAAMALERSMNVQVRLEERKEDVPCLRWRDGRERDVTWERKAYGITQ